MTRREIDAEERRILAAEKTRRVVVTAAKRAASPTQKNPNPAWRTWTKRWSLTGSRAVTARLLLSDWMTTSPDTLRSRRPRRRKPRPQRLPLRRPKSLRRRTEAAYAQQIKCLEEQTYACVPRLSLS